MQQRLTCCSLKFVDFISYFSYSERMKESDNSTDSIVVPEWVKDYRPRRLKQPKGGRIFQVPPKKTAMRNARLILRRLRAECYDLTASEQTAYVLGVLREICPFVFEELLLHCCEDLGWKVERSCYTYDGGIDGVFWDERGRKVLIQAKRYTGAIHPQHILDFAEVVLQDTQAVGGILMHTGITDSHARSLIGQLPYLNILDGYGLRELVLQ
jgi:restriction system protein